MEYPETMEIRVRTNGCGLLDEVSDLYNAHGLTSSVISDCNTILSGGGVKDIAQECSSVFSLQSLKSHIPSFELQKKRFFPPMCSTMK